MARDWALHTITHHNTFTTTHRKGIYNFSKNRRTLRKFINLLRFYFPRQGKKFKRNFINCFAKDRKEGKEKLFPSMFVCLFMEIFFDERKIPLRISEYNKHVYVGDQIKAKLII